MQADVDAPVSEAQEARSAKRMISESSTTAENPERRVSTTDAVVYVAILSVLATVARYYFGFTTHHYAILPSVMHIMDPTYMASDPFVQAARDYGAHYFVLRTLAWSSTLLTMPVAYVVLTLLCNATVAATSYWAALRFFGRGHFTAMVCTAMVLFPTSIKLSQAIWLSWQSLTPASLATPLVLIGMVLAVCLRPVTAIAFVMVGSLMHPLIGLVGGGVCLTVLGLCWLFYERLSKPAAILTRAALFARLAGCGLAFAVFVYFVFLRAMPGNIEPGSFNEIYGFFRNAHHCVPSAFYWYDWIYFPLFVGAAAMQWRSWWGSECVDQVSRAAAIRFVLPAVVVLALCLGGYVFVELVPNKLWITAQVYRMNFVTKWTGMLLLGTWVARTLADPGVGRRIAAMVCLFGTGRAQPAVAAMAMAAGGLIRRMPALVWGIVGVLLAGAAWLTHVDGARVESLQLAVALGVAVWIFSVRSPWLRIGAPILAVLGVTLARTGVVEVPGIPVAKMNLERTDHRVDAASRFARTLPDDAFFVTPVNDGGRFRLMSRRRILITPDMIPPGAILEWRSLLLDTYGNHENGAWRKLEHDSQITLLKAVLFDEGKRPTTSFIHMLDFRAAVDARYRWIGDERLRYLRRTYGVTHALLYAETKTRLPVLFTGKLFRIVEIPG